MDINLGLQIILQENKNSEVMKETTNMFVSPKNIYKLVSQIP